MWANKRLGAQCSPPLRLQFVRRRPGRSIAIPIPTRQTLESAALAVEYCKFPVVVCAYFGPMGEKRMVKRTLMIIQHAWNGARMKRRSFITCKYVRRNVMGKLK